jgi:hypothetical protein
LNFINILSSSASVAQHITVVKQQAENSLSGLPSLSNFQVDQEKEVWEPLG